MRRPRILPSSKGQYRWVLGMGVGLFALLVPRTDALAAGDDIALVKNQNVVRLELAGQCVMEYQHKPNPNKPYVRLLCTPQGVNVLRDSPKDHRHHHGLMFAVGVDGVDFWAEFANSGLQQADPPNSGQTKSNVGSSPRSDRRCQQVFEARFGQHLRWTDAQGRQILLVEDRHIAWHRSRPVVDDRPLPPVHLLTWTSTLSVPEGKKSVMLDGRAYFGLGMRFVEDMDHGGRFFNANGGQGVAQTNDKHSSWCAYTATVGNKPVTVAMFDDPENARHPAIWFTMDNPFAYLSATLGLKKEPMKIEAGKPLRLRYAVALWDGRVSAEVIQSVYEHQFCRPE